jgi:signal transduction histidine kinase
MLDAVIDNAIKYAGRDSTVEVRLDQLETGHAEIAIDDDGPGLDDRELVTVGRRFWRSPRHHAQPGTGLGLAIVEQLARANGGESTVSRSTRGGLLVTIRLRVSPDVPEVRRAAADEIDLRTPQGGDPARGR